MKRQGIYVMICAALLVIALYFSYGIVGSDKDGGIEERGITQQSDLSEKAELSQQTVDEAARSKLLSAFGKLPLHFIANQGQLDERVVYYARSEGATVFCSEEGLLFGFQMGSISLKLRNAKPVRPEARDELPGKVNYFIGDDPASWETDVPTFREIVYRGVYPGVDLVYSGDQRRLKYTFYVHPGSDPDQIQMIYEGTGPLRVDEETGELIIETSWGEMRDAAPLAYQDMEGIRKPVDASFRIVDEKRVAFAMGEYDKDSVLIVDPLYYSTYLGGSDGDMAQGIALDRLGNAYVAGYTSSLDFPGATGFNGGIDAFVTKFSSSGGLVYSTYLGGSAWDSAYGIAVDKSQNVYVAGETSSSVDFPTTDNAYDKTYNRGLTDAFVTKFSSSGGLVYSTYLGGSDSDVAYGIAVDDSPYSPHGPDQPIYSPRAIVVGVTFSSIGFPTTDDAYDREHNGNADAFVSKFSESGSRLIYSTYLGGSSADRALGIAVGVWGNAYVTGGTFSPNFPATDDAYDKWHDGLEDAFVTKLSSSGSSLTYSTFLGGRGYDIAYDIALGGSGLYGGNAYVAGGTLGVGWPLENDFPTTENAYDRSYNGNWDAFVSKISSSGGSLIYSTYLGGINADRAKGIAVDTLGNAYVAGVTESSDFPTPNAYDSSHNGGWDAFVSKISSNGRRLTYSTYLGGNGWDSGEGIAVDNSAYNVCVVGRASFNFPLKNPYDSSCIDGMDAFVTRLSTTYILSVRIYQGWNMMSCPGDPIVTSFTELLTGTDILPYALTWDADAGRYVSTDLFEFSRAYWWAATGDSQIPIEYVPRATFTTPVKTGWNMIGSVNGSVPANSMVSDPPNSVLPYVLTWDAAAGRYISPPDIVPGRGHWAAATQNATLTVSYPPPVSTAELVVTEPLWQGVITAGSGKDSQELTFGAHADASDGVDMMDMPIPPRLGDVILDAYFVGDDIFGMLSGDIKRKAGTVSWELKVSSKKAVKLTWDIAGVPPDVSLTLIGDGKKTDMRERKSMTLSKGEHRLTLVASSGIVLAAPTPMKPVLEHAMPVVIPVKTQLRQNYPNPFNPETWIPFELAEPRDVKVLIYDSRGSLIRTLDLGHLDAGAYITREQAAYWDGRDEAGEDVASGLYFYTIQAGEFTATKKMSIAR